MLENRNGKKIDASDDNPDANANSKEDGDLINCNNETPNANEDIHFLQVIGTPNVRDQMVPKEQWETRSSNKDKNINHLNIFN